MTLFDVESTDFLLAEIFLQLLEVVREGIDNAIAVDERVTVFRPPCVRVLG